MNLFNDLQVQEVSDYGKWSRMLLGHGSANLTQEQAQKVHDVAMSSDNRQLLVWAVEVNKQNEHSSIDELVRWANQVNSKQQGE